MSSRSQRSSSGRGSRSANKPLPSRSSAEAAETEAAPPGGRRRGRQRPRPASRPNDDHDAPSRLPPSLPPDAAIPGGGGGAVGSSPSRDDSRKDFQDLRPVILPKDPDEKQIADRPAIWDALSSNLDLVAAKAAEADDKSMLAQIEETRNQMRIAQINECLSTATAVDVAAATTMSMASSAAAQMQAQAQPGQEQGQGQAQAQSPTGEGADSNANADTSNDATAVPLHFHLFRRLHPDQENREDSALTIDDAADIYADVTGRLHPHRRQMADRAAALRKAIDRLPAEQKCAYLKARERNPMLLNTAAHVALFINAEKDEEDDFCPDRAAARMANYWDQRRALLGEDAYSSGSIRLPNDADYVRLYCLCQTDAVWAEDDAVAACLQVWVQDKLDALDDHLDMIPHRKKVAFALAEEGMDPMATSHESKILFLISSDFDIVATRNRMVNYFQLKADLFGKERLLDKITLDRLMEEHRNDVELGFMSLLPDADSSGRVLCFLDWEIIAKREHSTVGITRVCWYVFHMAIEKHTCRDPGLVIISNCRNVNPHEINHDVFSALNRMQQCLPFRLRAVHDCFGDTPVPWWYMKFIYPWVKWALGRKLRARYVTHEGVEQTLRELDAVGISREQLPIVLGGEDGPESWRAALEARRAAGL